MRLKREGGISLEMPQQKRASFRIERIFWLFLSCTGTVRVLHEWRRECWETSGVASRVSRTFRGSRGKLGFLSRCCSGKGPHLALRGEFPGFSRVGAGNLRFLLSYDRDLRDLLVLPQESPVSMRVARGLPGFPSSQCRGGGPHLELRPEPQVSSPVLTWILGFLGNLSREVKPRL